MEKRKQFIINFIYYAIILSLVVLGLKYGLSWLMPFVIAFSVAFILKPVINKMNVHLKIKRGVCAAICVLSFYLVAGLLLSLLGFQIFMWAKEVFFRLPEFYTTEIEPVLLLTMDKMQEALTRFDPGLEFVIEDFILQTSSNIGQTISSISVSALSKLSGVITKVPSYFVGTLITIIASFFIAMDYYDITYFIARQLTQKQRQFVYEIREYATGALVKYAKSYSLILSITFIELSVGLLLLRVENAITIAFAIAILDILPVLGTGGVLIPWGLLSIVSGNLPFGVGIIVLYLMITIIRNTIEPKIIGSQVGLHPVATLLAMFIGTKLFGFIGLFLLPISLAIAIQLNKAGKIKVFK